MVELQQLPRFVGSRATDAEFLEEDTDSAPVESIVDRRLTILLGEPGSGKSTAARFMCGLDASHVLEDLREHSEATLEMRLVEVLEQGPRLLILDSLDEWSGAMNKLAGIIRRRIVPALASNLKVVATCRTGDVNSALLEVFRAADKSLGNDGTDDSFTVHLLPLRRIDAIAFIEARGFESSEVLSKLADFDAEPLAANVGLLDLVCQTIEHDGAVLQSRAGLFESATSRALDLADTVISQPGSTLEPRKLLRIAESAAGLTLLGGRSSIRIEGLANPGELPFEDLLSGWESGEQALAEDARMVLRSPLFTQFGAGARAFAHKSIASYLAARFISTSELGPEQITTLVMTPPEDGVDAAVIPQLRETCAWLLVLDPARFGWIVDADPYSLSRYGTVIADADVKSRIVEGLLAAADDLVFKLNWSDSFTGLVHDSLSQQLAPALTTSDQARAYVALRILREAYVPGLEGLVRDLIIDPTTSVRIRTDAVRLLIREGHGEHLIEHVDFLLDVDEHHEILGTLVEELWPGMWPTSQMLASLRRPDEHYFGSYNMALTDLPKKLSKVDAADVLAWVSAQFAIPTNSDREPEWLIRLATDILKSLDIDDIVEIGRAAMDTCWWLVGHHKSLPVDLAAQDEDSVRHLLALLVDAQPESESSIYFLSYAHDLERVPLLGFASLDWLHEQADRSVGRQRRAWLYLLRNRLNPSDNASLERVWAFREKPGWDLFAPWFDAVELGSELAEHMKSGAKARAELESLGDEREKESQFIANKIAEFREITKSEPNRFWELVVWLDAGGMEFGTDLFESKNGELLGEDFESFITDSAAAYLASISPGGLPKFKIGVFSRPMLAACRAATTLVAHAPDRLDDLGSNVWAALVEPVVTFPAHYGNTEVDRDLVVEVLARVAASVTPSILVSGYRSALEIHESAGEQFHGMRLAEAFGGANWIAFLAEQIAIVGPSNFERVMQLAFPLAPEAALARCEQVVRESSMPAQISQAILLISEQFASVAGGLFLELFERDLKLAKSVTLELAPARRWQGTVLGGEPVQLAEIYEKLRTLFPTEDDPPRFGVRTVTPIEEAGELRDSLLSSLVEAGTGDSVQAIRKLRDEHPDWSLQDAWVRARERLYQSAWAPVSAFDLVRLASDETARLIRSDVELRSVALETLDELQTWLNGETPQAFALWNAASIPGRPKDENSVSDWYCHGLRLVLKGRNIVVNREVEVTRGTGAGMGSRNDIRLDAAGEDGTSSVVIEVKGCWNAKLKYGVQVQLDKRYLTDSNLTQGIFLVVCFPADQTEAPTTFARHTIGSLRQRLDGYLSAVDNDIAIVIHDARLPDLAGAPKAN